MDRTIYTKPFCIQSAYIESMTFISLEGLDGAGTTSIARAIGEEYPNSVSTKEPSDLEFGKQVRERLSQEDSDSMIDFFLFMCDRIDHINKEVQPAHDDGELVVSDRYGDSTRAYQPVALSNSGVFEDQMTAKAWIESVMAPWEYTPDLTIYLDISVDTALERADGDEKYEKRAFLEKVRDNYEGVVESDAHGGRIVRVDAERPLEEVEKSVLGKIDVVPADKV